MLEACSWQRTQMVLTALKMILGYMMEEGKIAQNVALQVKMEGKPRERGKFVIGRDVPTKKEVNTMLEHIVPRWQPWLLTMVFTGMRISESLGLTWNAVDFDKGDINIWQRREPRARVANDRRMGPPKSEAGHRAIPMGPAVVRALRQWRLICPRTADGRLNYVFPNNSGGIMHPDNLTRDYYCAMQVSIGLVNERGGARYSVHKLRHFYASWAIEQGFAMKRLQEMIGHSSIQMTSDRYGHWFPNAVDDQARLVAGEKSVFGAG
jgi:integrase